MNCHLPQENLQDTGAAKPLERLFSAFERNGIQWCSWKSNQHLQDGLLGKTDIDVLFLSADRHVAKKIMMDNGFIMFRTASHRVYPGIEDAISIDPVSGRILHVHAHFLFCLGEKNLKSIVLPWNAYILSNKMNVKGISSVYVSSPRDELVLLLLRESLKIRVRDIVFAKSGSVWGGQGFFNELVWLKERVTPLEVKDCAATLLNPVAAEIIYEMLSHDITLGRLLKLRSEIREIAVQKKWFRIREGMGLLQSWWREGVTLFARILEKVGIRQTFIVRRRVLPGSGLVVAVLGPDGAGKSTVSKTVVSQWSNKIDIVSVYLGSGDGSRSLLQKMMKAVFAAARLFRNKSNMDVGDTGVKNGESDVRMSRSIPFFAIVGVLSKKKQMRHIKRMRARGFVVVCDRWPQNIVYGLNDGPMLENMKDSGNFFLRFLALWEEKEFRKICSVIQPDLVVRLIPSLEVAVARKQENISMIEIIKKKISTLQMIRFPAEVEDCTIDADRPLDCVLNEVRDHIWNHLGRRSAITANCYECVGLPGAGKTAACNEIKKDKNFKAVIDIFFLSDPMSMIKKIWLTARSFARDPVIYVLVIKIVFDLRLWMSRESLALLFRLPAQKLRMQDAAVGNSKFFLEQLLLQNVWSALVSADLEGVSPDILSPFIGRMYRDIDMQVLYFDVPVDEAAMRVQGRERGTSRFDGLPRDVIETRLRKYSKLMDDIMLAARYAGLDIVHIDAAQSFEQVIKSVKLSLE